MSKRRNCGVLCSGTGGNYGNNGVLDLVNGRRDALVGIL